MKTFKLNIELNKKLKNVLESLGYDWSDRMAFIVGTRGKRDPADIYGGFYRCSGSFCGVLSNHFSDPSEITDEAALRLLGIAA